MSWYATGGLPDKVRDSITSQDWAKSGWACGCSSNSDADGTPLVWLCRYHEGYLDGITERTGLSKEQQR